ncbi:aldo/keto reductase [Kitasatospora viridis]|nr:aldo/keto reductase [Kitasatospora viridis]
MTDTAHLIPERVRLGRSELAVHPFSLGGNVFGWTADRDASFAVLDAYTAAGGNFIDTADVYSVWAPGHQGGESETIIGEWVRERGNRDSVLIASKVGAHPAALGLGAANIRSATEDSLRRLGVETIDLLYTHKDDPEVPVEEIVSTLDQLVREGKVRAVAASNISAERLTAALEFSAKEGLARYEALQPHYNLLSRDTYEGPLAEVAAAHGIGVVPYAALAGGFLTGKYRPGGPSVPSPRAEGATKRLADPRALRVLEAVEQVAAAHGVQPSSVATAWLAAQPTVVAPIASARTPEQLVPLLTGARLVLTAEQLELLDAASA